MMNDKLNVFQLRTKITLREEEIAFKLFEECEQVFFCDIETKLCHKF